MKEEIKTTERIKNQQMNFTKRVIGTAEEAKLFSQFPDPCIDGRYIFLFQLT
jgi:hypothetical protein